MDDVSLRELSEKASGGSGRADLWFTNDNTPWILGPEVDAEPDRFHVVARMPSFRHRDVDARRQWRFDKAFIVALVNAYRAGRLHDDTALRAAEARGRAAGQWQDIETAPKDGNKILLAHEHAVFDGWWAAGIGWVDGDQDGLGELRAYEPTHWMPLPNLPLAATPPEPPALDVADRTEGGL